MPLVIGVRFKNAGKLYYFGAGSLWPTAGDSVIVETARGMEYAEVVTGVQEIDDAMITPPLRQVIRIATDADAKRHELNIQRAKDAYPICLKKIQDHRLKMKLVRVEYTFDNSKMTVYFTADGRIQFSELAKDLGSYFRTHVELRQIGSRDEAKMLGGLGLCGRPLCCTQFLGDFQPVTVKMARDQGIAPNPTKISGLCCKLMCCLKYEHSQYEEILKRLPKTGKEVITPKGRGCVTGLNILKESVKVRVTNGDSYEFLEFPASEVTRLNAAEPKAANHACPCETANADTSHDDPEEEFIATDMKIIQDGLSISEDA